jgi:hypothetical protein
MWCEGESADDDGASGDRDVDEERNEGEDDEGVDHIRAAGAG